MGVLERSVNRSADFLTDYNRERYVMVNVVFSTVNANSKRKKKKKKKERKKETLRAKTRTQNMPPPGVDPGRYREYKPWTRHDTNPATLSKGGRKKVMTWIYWTAD